jgi:hypothetical protein
MKKVVYYLASVAAVGVLALSSALGTAQEKKGETKLPDVVKKTFDARFPKAKIEKIDVETEHGVEVYDVEFRDGKTEKETDITTDGTMLEYTVVIRPKDVPKEAMKPIRKAAEGATMGRTEKIELSYELKDGKAIKLAKPVMQYAVEMKKGDKSAEIIVDEHGKIVEEPKWETSKEKKPPA